MPRAVESQFYIEGLTKFNGELKKLGGALPKSLKDFNVKAALEIVARGRAKADTAQAKLAAKSLRASKSATAVAVLLGNNSRYAFARGAEFGAKRYAQFRPWRGNQWQAWDGGPGYFLQPAIREVGDHVLDEYWDSIRDLRMKAFPD